MKQIDRNEALARVFQNPDLASLCGYHLDVQGFALLRGGEAARDSYSAYESENCTILRTYYTYDDGSHYLSHVVLTTADDACPTGAVEHIFDEDEHEYLDIFELGEPTPELDKLPGFRIYSGLGIKPEDAERSPHGGALDCTVDGYHIRRLTLSDRDTVLAFSDGGEDNFLDAQSVYDGCRAYAKELLTEEGWHHMEQYPEDAHYMYGAWEGDTLLGLVSTRMNDLRQYAAFCGGSALVTISDLVVSPVHRNKGVARALVKAVRSVYPDARYVYEAKKYNTVSAKTAASAGLVFLGSVHSMA